MKKETTIDLAKFEEAKKAIEEAQKTISCMQDQLHEMLLDEIENNPVFECDCSLRTTHIEHSRESYSSTITVSDTPIYLNFYVSPTKCVPDLSSDFILIMIDFDCSPFGICGRLINNIRDLTITLHFTSGEYMLLQYKASEGN